MTVFKNAISYRAFNSGGKGGQHGNRSANAIEASLDPAVARELGVPELTATATLKSQHQSKRLAQRVLKSKIASALSKDKERFGAGSERVRNYHQPDDRVTCSTGWSGSYRRVLGKAQGFAEAVDSRRSRKIEHER